MILVDTSVWIEHFRSGNERLKRLLLQEQRGAVIPRVGKTRITIYLDDTILKRFKAQSERTGKG